MAIDTLKAANELQELGMPKSQAEAIAQLAFRVNTELVSREMLNHLREEMEKALSPLKLDLERLLSETQLELRKVRSETQLELQRMRSEIKYNR